MSVHVQVFLECGTPGCGEETVLPLSNPIITHEGTLTGTQSLIWLANCQGWTETGNGEWQCPDCNRRGPR